MLFGGNQKRQRTAVTRRRLHGLQIGAEDLDDQARARGRTGRAVRVGRRRGQSGEGDAVRQR